MVDFSPYLKFICTTPRYQETLSRYTATDAIHLKLEAQTLVWKELEGRETEKSRQQAEPFPVLEGLRKYAANHVLLSGKPGSGKSTTLKRLLREMAEVAQLKVGAKHLGHNLSTQPKFVYLNALPSEDLRQREVWEDLKIPVLVQLKSERSIVETIRAEFRQGQLAVSTKEIDNWLVEGKLFLLLDGVNEIPSEKLRRQLQQFREEHPHIPMIFTTRNLAVGGDFGIEKKLEMLPLTEAQMREFVGKYLPEYREVLLEQLQDRLREVAETPLLLKMLCEVFNPQTQQIPQSKGELFQAFDEKYNQHKQYPPVSGNFRRFKSEVLQHLAFEMIRGDREKPTEAWLTVSHRKAEGILEGWLGKRGETDAATKAKEWLEDLLEHHLLQVAADSREIEFHHQLFQEYYAAKALLVMLEKHKSKKHESDVMNDEQLQHFFLNYLKWTEPIALMLGLLENEEQAFRVVRLALDLDLQLGARLAGEVKPEFQKQTVSLIESVKVPKQWKFWFVSLKGLVRIPEWLQVKLLGITQSNAAIPRLHQALQNEDYNVRENAVEALVKLDSPTVTVIPALLQTLQDEDYNVRMKAAEALIKLDSPTAIPRLIQAFQDKNSFVRKKAEEALIKLNSPTAIAGLFQVIEEGDSFMRRNAVEVLGKLDSPIVIPGLLQALQDEDSLVCNEAKEALIKLNSPAAISGLLPYLPKSTAEVLGKLGSEQNIPRLLAALENQDSLVRIKAAMSLGQIKQDKAAHTLPNLLALISTELGETVLDAISNIQQNCQFYNYTIFHKQLPPVVIPQPPESNVYNIHSDRVQIIEENNGTVIGQQNLKTG
ncbi:MAG: hypothetical protein F6J96_20930 [Symploca sp. SIO1C2]|nr:hypothetical protein [Symploca sp. SIO1C2]